VVLAQMLGPGFAREPFDQLARIGRILGDAPAIGAVAPSLARKAMHRLHEGCAIRRGDLVLDQDQHRAAIMLDRLRGQRLRPMATSSPAASEAR
jgi:hypothetical protein